MRAMYLAAIAAISFFAAPLVAPAQQIALPPGATIETHFSPGPDPAFAVAVAVSEAKREARVMTYQLTNGPIINALRQAAGRGVDVKVIIDGKVCDTPRLAPVRRVLHEAGVETRCDRQHPIHHNKVAVIDGETVVTGSFNFSPSAQRNAENTNVIRGAPPLAALYLAIWQEHWTHSDP